MSITEFLEARIAEDEVQAEAASVSMYGDKHAESWDWGSYVLGCERDATEAQDAFIVNWWPARVLAECAAKRAIVDLHPVYIYTDEEPGFSMELNDHVCPIGVPGPTVGPCKTLRALAAVYKDHPDYLRAWTP